MKILLFSTVLVLALFSCNSNKDNKSTTLTINPKDIQPGEIVHDSLDQLQIEKITKIQSTFFEVYPISLEETISNFRRDLNVDNEIAIWLSMANAYEKYVESKQGKLDLNTKTEVYKLILSRSMMSTNEAIKNSKLKILSERDAQEVLSLYSEKPDPIDVIAK